MIKSTKSLLQEYINYKQPVNKIQREIKMGNLFPIGNGFYETDNKVDKFALAGLLSNPSYISFETALSYHGLIPEGVYSVTSASLLKNKNKTICNYFGTYRFSDIPKRVFNRDLNYIILNNGYSFIIATKEKALCDTLYKKSPIRSIYKMEDLLINSMRMDEDDLKELDFKEIEILKDLYHSTNINYLYLYLRRLHRLNG